MLHPIVESIEKKHAERLPSRDEIRAMAQRFDTALEAVEEMEKKAVGKSDAGYWGWKQQLDDAKSEAFIAKDLLQKALTRYENADKPILRLAAEGNTHMNGITIKLDNMDYLTEQRVRALLKDGKTVAISRLATALAGGNGLALSADERGGTATAEGDAETDAADVKRMREMAGLAAK